MQAQTPEDAPATAAGPLRTALQRIAAHSPRRGIQEKGWTSLDGRFGGGDRAFRGAPRLNRAATLFTFLRTSSLRYVNEVRRPAAPVSLRETRFRASVAYGCVPQDFVLPVHIRGEQETEGFRPAPSNPFRIIVECFTHGRETPHRHGSFLLCGCQGAVGTTLPRGGASARIGCMLSRNAVSYRHNLILCVMILLFYAGRIRLGGRLSTMDNSKAYDT